MYEALMLSLELGCAWYLPEATCNSCSLHFECTVDKTEYMVGSYGPKKEEYEFLTTMEESPKGMLARGTYNIKSKFTDDDKHDHLSWEWSLAIKKEWKDWFLLTILPSSSCARSLCLLLAVFLLFLSGLCVGFKLLLSPSIHTRS